MVIATPESIITGVCYIITLITTFRASSRALYMLQHNGTLGVIDGPLITRRRQLDDGGDGGDDYLWEVTFAFEQAVKYSVMNDDDEDDNNDSFIVVNHLNDDNDDDDDDGLLSSSDSIPLLKNDYNNNDDDDDENEKINHDESSSIPYSLSPYPPTRSHRPSLISTTIPPLTIRSLVESSKPSSSSSNYLKRRLLLQTKKDSTELLNDIKPASENRLRRMANVITKPLLRTSRQISSYASETLTRLSSPRKRLRWGMTMWGLTGSPYRYVKRRIATTTKGMSDFWRRSDDFDEENHHPSTRRVSRRSILISIPPMTSPENTTITKTPRKRRRRRRTARVTSYASDTFRELRHRFGVSDRDFLKSLTGPFVSFASNSKGAARAGGFFFFSRDGAYLIKTIKKNEAKSLLSMLPRYHHYMKKNGRRSLLTRFFGLYRISIGDEEGGSSDDGSGSTTRRTRGFLSSMFSSKDKTQYILIMNSVFPSEGSQFIKERFDLKGSTVGRECSPEERRKKGHLAILKDMDLAKEQTITTAQNRRQPPPLSSTHLNIGPRAKSSLLSQLRRDIRLLAKSNVMDYSLLVGVVHLDDPSPSSPPLTSPLLAPLLTPLAPLLYLTTLLQTLSYTLLTSTISTLPLPYHGAERTVVDGGRLSILRGKRNDCRALYYFGVIDFLSPWTLRKVLERELKGLCGYDREMVSCVGPREYGERFLGFVDEYVT